MNKCRVPGYTIRHSRRLTARELEVIALIATGLTNQQIADHLMIGRRTAETHVDHIRNKLGLQSRLQIALWAIRSELIQ